MLVGIYTGVLIVYSLLPRCTEKGYWDLAFETTTMFRPWAYDNMVLYFPLFGGNSLICSPWLTCWPRKVLHPLRSTGATSPHALEIVSLQIRTTRVVYMYLLPLHGSCLAPSAFFVAKLRRDRRWGTIDDAPQP
jgi:hypothetical protein